MVAAAPDAAASGGWQPSGSGGMTSKRTDVVRAGAGRERGGWGADAWEVWGGARPAACAEELFAAATGWRRGGGGGCQSVAARRIASILLIPPLPCAPPSTPSSYQAKATHASRTWIAFLVRSRAECAGVAGRRHRRSPPFKLAGWGGEGKGARAGMSSHTVRRSV